MMTSRPSEHRVLAIGLRRTLKAVMGDLIPEHPSSPEQVIGLCRRFPLLVAELSNRHSNRPALSITDEYDVQDLLRSVLRLDFQDVRSEEWNPSYGGVQSRSDLLLKPERIVIETKMTRKGLGDREIVQQLIADKAQYRVHPDCGTLICFVYNPDLSLRNPTAIESDLSGHTDGLTTVVVISPRGL